MKIQNIVSKKTYQKDGQEKATWPICGTLRTNDAGKQFIELNMFPGTTFYVFDQKPRDTEPVKNFTSKNDPSEIQWEE